MLQICNQYGFNIYCVCGVLNISSECATALLLICNLHRHTDEQIYLAAKNNEPKFMQRCCGDIFAPFIILASEMLLFSL